MAAGDAPVQIARHGAERPISPAASPEDRYDVEAEHARGGTGVILRARDVHLEWPIAIKELGDTTNPRAVDRFGRGSCTKRRGPPPPAREPRHRTTTLASFGRCVVGRGAIPRVIALDLVLLHQTV